VAASIASRREEDVGRSFTPSEGVEAAAIVGLMVNAAASIVKLPMLRDSMLWIASSVAIS
jgi:hypothetical protein